MNKPRTRENMYPEEIEEGIGYARGNRLADKRKESAEKRRRRSNTAVKAIGGLVAITLVVGGANKVLGGGDEESFKESLSGLPTRTATIPAGEGSKLTEAIEDVNPGFKDRVDPQEINEFNQVVESIEDPDGIVPAGRVDIPIIEEQQQK